jgi:hypothetical protein
MADLEGQIWEEIMQFKKRPLGASGAEITTVGYGAFATGGDGWSFGWGPQEPQSLATR